MISNFRSSDTALDSSIIPCRINEINSLKDSYLNNIEFRLAKGALNATKYDRYLSVAYTVIERIIKRWIDTQEAYFCQRPKRVYYISMEFLIGRMLGNSLINLGIEDICQKALEELNVDLEEVRECEVDAGLGNGGLGRLAACFLDSLATMSIPAMGYGLRYDYGLFHQVIVNGRQQEKPDNWLAQTNPWENARPEHQYVVRYGGETKHSLAAKGKKRTNWCECEEVIAKAYDTPVPGYQTNTVNTLRLWTSRASEDFNLENFNQGDYFAACEKQIMSEYITKVLYPEDSSFKGRELRLKQEYFLVSASIQDIIRRFKTERQDEKTLDWTTFPDAVAIQLNDTHPALAIPELMRILTEEESVSWKTAWKITYNTFSYTNHTLLPEALEEWPVPMLHQLLPHHLEIIYKINLEFLKKVSRAYPGNVDRVRRMSLINEEGKKSVRMAHLAVVGSHKVNGVAELHTQLMKETIFHDFYDLWPSIFVNVTNGIAPRRWLRKSNPQLSQLITDAIGEKWVKDLALLRNLEAYADDSSFQEQWREVKQSCKDPLIEMVRRETNIVISPHSIFDVQIKRIHEYKRQLLFALYIIATYLRIKENPEKEYVPRTCLIAGKAAPGYHFAKATIHLINRITETINSDPDTHDYLRVAFIPNYRVSAAEKIIPAANLSEQISTAGKEASGTGNMKLALNGALTIGTMDGANIEICREVGEENIFIFGKTAAEIQELKRQGYHPKDFIARSPILQRVMHLLQCDFFCPGEPGLFQHIYDALVYQDEYCVLADFDAYLETQDIVSQTYSDQTRWTRMSILNTARCGIFSSDRTITEYAREVWNAKSVYIPDKPQEKSLGIVER